MTLPRSKRATEPGGGRRLRASALGLQGWLYVAVGCLMVFVGLRGLLVG
jgi:hypothetical protein